MKKDDFKYYILDYIFILLILFLYQYFNLNGKLAITLIALTSLILLYITRNKNIKSKTPKIILVVFIILCSLPYYLDIENIFIFYLILIALLVGVEYFYNIKKYSDDSKIE